MAAAIAIAASSALPPSARIACPASAAARWGAATTPRRCPAVWRSMVLAPRESRADSPTFRADLDQVESQSCVCGEQMPAHGTELRLTPRYDCGHTVPSNEDCRTKITRHPSPVRPAAIREIRILFARNALLSWIPCRDAGRQPLEKGVRSVLPLLVADGRVSGGVNMEPRNRSGHRTNGERLQRGARNARLCHATGIRAAHARTRKRGRRREGGDAPHPGTDPAQRRRSWRYESRCPPPGG